MSLKDYFENIEGRGILATADESGNVDVALYARPHVIDDKTVKIDGSPLMYNCKEAYLNPYFFVYGDTEKQWLLPFQDQDQTLA